MALQAPVADADAFDVTDLAVAPPTRGRRLRDWRGVANSTSFRGVPVHDVCVAAAVTLSCVGFSTAFLVPAWSLRFAVLLATVPAGLVALARLVRERDRAAIAGAAFLGWASISALASDQVRVALIGQIGKESSVLILVGLVGMWALGRGLTDVGRRMTQIGLVAAMSIHALVAILQMVTQSESPELGLQYGRSTGLTANPVYLGGVMAGAAGLCAVRACRTSGRAVAWWTVGVAMFVAAANLSGSRVALVGALLVVIVGAATSRRWRSALLVTAVGVAAVVGSQVIVDHSGTGVSTTGRVTGEAINVDGRFDIWRFGVEAIPDNPVLGVGAGGFRSASQPNYTAEFVRTKAPPELGSAWFDAHNIVVEYAVTTGLVGVALLGAFAVLALRRARGAFVALFAGIAVTWLFEPVSVGTGSVALLALGAAWPRATDDPPAARGRAALRVAAAAGCLLGAFALVSDWRLARAADHADAAELRHAAVLLPPDAIVEDLIAQSVTLEFLEGDATATELIDARRDVVDAEPNRPLWWVRLAGAQIFTGDLGGARTSLDRAIELYPWHPAAWPLMLEVAVQTGDDGLEQLARSRVCALDPAADGCGS